MSEANLTRQAKLSERLHLPDARHRLPGPVHPRAVDASLREVPRSLETPSLPEPPKPVQRIPRVSPGAVPSLALAAALPRNGSAERCARTEEQRTGAPQVRRNGDRSRLEPRGGRRERVRRDDWELVDADETAFRAAESHVSGSRQFGQKVGRLGGTVLSLLLHVLLPPPLHDFSVSRFHVSPLRRIDAFSTYLHSFSWNSTSNASSSNASSSNASSSNPSSNTSSSSIAAPTILTILWKHVTFLFCSRVSTLQPASLQQIIDRIQALTLHTAPQFDFSAATRPSTSLSVDLDEAPRVVSTVSPNVERPSPHPDAVFAAALFGDGSLRSAR